MTSLFDLTVDTPFGEQQGRLNLDTDSGLLTGWLETSAGRTELLDGSGDEARFEFTTRIRTPMGRMKARVTGQVDGDDLTATARLPLGRAAIRGTRREVER